MNVCGVLFFLPVLVACAHGPTDCSHFNVTVVADESASIPPPGPHVTLEYSSAVVDSQYIVTFTSYYTTEARDGFISAALRPFQDWSILPRANPSADYPSDFTLLKLTSSQQEALRVLTQHPAVKQVTPEKMLTRILSSGGGKCHSVWSICMTWTRVHVNMSTWACM